LKQLWYLLRFPFELSPAHASSTGLPAVLSLGLFGLLLMVFAASPVTTSSDSKWSLYTAMSFAQGHGGDLTEYLPRLEQEQFYSIEHPDGRPRSRYPIGTSLLVMPAVVVSSWLFPHFAEDMRAHNPVGTEHFLASVIGAAAGVVFFWVVLTQFQSLAIALASTFRPSFSPCAPRCGRRRPEVSGSTGRWS